MSERTFNGVFDVVIIGGGVNGLVAAAYLARSGKRTLLLEKKDRVGGLAVTETFFPGCRFSSLVDGVGYLSSEVVAELTLSQHGLNIIPNETVVTALQPNGQHLTISQDVNETMKEIARFSEADASAYPRFLDMLNKTSVVIEALMNVTPPDLPEVGLSSLSELWPVVKSLRKIGRKDFTEVLRLMPMPIADLLDEWFEADEVKGAIAASSLLYCSWGPQEAGTGYIFFTHRTTSNNGLFRSSGAFEGGIGALSEALASAARAFGAQISTGTPVKRILVERNAACGVELENDEQIAARSIVSAVNMNTTFTELLDPYFLEQSFIRGLKNIKYRGTSARVHFVLDGLPEFRGINGDAGHRLAGHIQIAPTMTYLQKAYDPVKYGRCSDAPYLDIFISTLADSSRCDGDTHLMSVTVKYMPYHLREGDWDSLRGDLARLVIEQIAVYAPGFDELITQQKVLTPVDLERDYNLPEGNYTHGQMTLDQFMWMRPVPGYGQYRAPIEYLYLCGAATHPGGVVNGISGKNAAREIRKGWRR